MKKKQAAISIFRAKICGPSRCENHIANLVHANCRLHCCSSQPSFGEGMNQSWVFPTCSTSNGSVLISTNLRRLQYSRAPIYNDAKIFACRQHSDALAFILPPLSFSTSRTYQSYTYSAKVCRNIREITGLMVFSLRITVCVIACMGVQSVWHTVIRARATLASGSHAMGGDGEHSHRLPFPCEHVWLWARRRELHHPSRVREYES